MRTQGKCNPIDKYAPSIGGAGALGAVRRQEQGQAIVEFALVMPILIILLMAVVFFAMAFNLQMVLNAAAREGARAWANNRAETSPCLATTTTLADHQCEPNNPETGFGKYVIPIVRKYVSDNGYDGENVVFEKVYVTKKELTTQELRENVFSVEDATKVRLIITYGYNLPTAGLNFELITLKAEYTFKRGT